MVWPAWFSSGSSWIRSPIRCFVLWPTPRQNQSAILGKRWISAVQAPGVQQFSMAAQCAALTVEERFAKRLEQEKAVLEVLLG